MDILLVRIQNFMGSWHTIKTAIPCLFSRASVIWKTHDRLLLADCTRTASLSENRHWVTGACASARNVAHSA